MKSSIWLWQQPSSQISVSNWDFQPPAKIYENFNSMVSSYPPQHSLVFQQHWNSPGGRLARCTARVWPWRGTIIREGFSWFCCCWCVDADCDADDVYVAFDVDDDDDHLLDLPVWGVIVVPFICDPYPLSVPSHVVPSYINHTHINIPYISYVYLHSCNTFIYHKHVHTVMHCMGSLFNLLFVYHHQQQGYKYK